MGGTRPSSQDAEIVAEIAPCFRAEQLGDGLRLGSESLQGPASFYSCDFGTRAFRLVFLAYVSQGFLIGLLVDPLIEVPRCLGLTWAGVLEGYCLLYESVLKLSLLGEDGVLGVSEVQDDQGVGGAWGCDARWLIKSAVFGVWSFRA